MEITVSGSATQGITRKATRARHAAIQAVQRASTARAHAAIAQATAIHAPRAYVIVQSDSTAISVPEPTEVSALHVPIMR